MCIGGVCVCVCATLSHSCQSLSNLNWIWPLTKWLNRLNLNDQWIIKVKFKVFYSSNHFMVLCIACSVMLVQSVPYLIFSPGPRIGVCMCVCVCVGGSCCHDRVACRSIHWPGHPSTPSSAIICMFGSGGGGGFPFGSPDGTLTW